MLRDRTIVGIVLRHELLAARRGAVLWLVSLGAMLALVSALQPALAAGPLAAKISSLPQAMRDALGLSIVDFNRPAAYLATNFAYVVLGTGAFGGLLGSRVIAKEELSRTGELLYAQPARRGAIVLGKALAAATYAIAVPLLLAIVPLAILSAVTTRELEAPLVFSLFVGCACTAFAFAGVGMLVASTSRQPRGVANVTLAIVFGTFVLGVFSALTPTLSFARWVSPFKLVEAQAIVANGGLDPRAVAILVGVGGACIALAIEAYGRRDLHA
ncbi:MAG: ABC transporter permease [Kofleriaceae bacterium]